jgi:DNA mismatch repair protein MutL
VRDAIREQLMQSRPAPSFSPMPQPQQAAGLPYSDFTQTMQDAPIYVLQPPPLPPPRFDFGDKGIPVNQPIQQTGPIQQDEPKNEPLKLRVPDTHGAFPAGTIPVETSMVRIGELRPLGQLHNSFIIAAGLDGLWIVDQHVAHERILFEQVLTQQAAGRVEMQQLLMPMIVQLSAEQQIEYARIADELLASGFDTEPFGNRTIAIKAAPAAIGLGELERVVLEILEIAENELRSVSLADLRRGIAASIACRAAIKINTPLDQRKMEWMLRTLAATEYPMACPHGRPVALQYGMREILRAFHRI